MTEMESILGTTQQTSPIPPAPSAETSSYAPRREPGARATGFAVDHTVAGEAHGGLLLSDGLPFTDSGPGEAAGDPIPCRRARQLVL